ncbi:MAG TPA: hypothetical protein ENG07_01130, partial [Candidatus Bathyarchaeota archaeon]|nr:hypothetical protein [Candidatus Bathyarchaeota archaeon]
HHLENLICELTFRCKDILNGYNLLCQAVNAVTGWVFTWDEGMTVGRRIVHLLRAFNVRDRIKGREVDRPSPRYGSAPDAGMGWLR